MGAPDRFTLNRFALAERVAELVVCARASDGWPLTTAGKPASADGCSALPASAERVATVRDALLALLAVDAPAEPSAVLTDEERNVAGLAAFCVDTGLREDAWRDATYHCRSRYRAIGSAAVEHVLRLRGGR